MNNEVYEEKLSSYISTLYSEFFLLLLSKITKGHDQDYVLAAITQISTKSSLMHYF
jgi:hypothetical protein